MPDGTSGTQSGATSAIRSHEQNLKFPPFLSHNQNFPNCIVHHVQIIYFNYIFSFSLPPLPPAFHSRLRCVIPILGWCGHSRRRLRAEQPLSLTSCHRLSPSSGHQRWVHLTPLRLSSSSGSVRVRSKEGGILSEIWHWNLFLFIFFNPFLKFQCLFFSTFS